MNTRNLIDKSLAEEILKRDCKKPPVPYIIQTNRTNYFYDTDGQKYEGAYRDEYDNWFYTDKNGKTVQCPKNTIIHM